MKIIIHRGTHQIGGCATEINTDNTRILIDFGTELSEGGGQDILQIEGLNYGTIDFDAVFFTHYHGDHIGKIENIPPQIPTYLGETACEIFDAYAKRVGMAQTSARLLPIKALEPIQIGNMKITPIPADHSAYDAFMYLIEADGKRVLHTGDFRLHGFRGKATLRLLRRYAADVDVLIIEGTRIAGGKHSGLDENDLQTKLKQLLKEHKYAFMLCSSTNIDRLAALHNATPRGRYFVCDKYQWQILKAVASNSESRWYKFKKTLKMGENLKLQERGFVMPVRANDDFAAMARKYPEAILIYSMWEGYLDGRSPAISNFVKPFMDSGKFFSLHSSGHASGADISEVCRAVSPKIGIIPIHTDRSDCFNSIVNEKIILLQDKEKFDIQNPKENKKWQVHIQKQSLLK